MNVIYKYPINPDLSALTLPMHSEILTVITQRRQPVLYVKLAEFKANVETREIFIVGTGIEFSEKNLKYINTFTLANDALVFHVFEKLKS